MRMSLGQIARTITQVKTQIERGQATIGTVAKVATAIGEIKEIAGPVTEAVERVNQVMHAAQQQATQGLVGLDTLTTFVEAIDALKNAQQLGRPTTMETLSQFNKAIVAFVMAALTIITTLTGINFGLTEGTLVTILGVLTPILVWLIPNYPK